MYRINADCGRCENTGLTLWHGRRDQGGSEGPCPRCRPAAAKLFCGAYARQLFERAGAIPAAPPMFNAEGVKK